MWRRVGARTLVAAVLIVPFVAAGLFVAAVILTPLPKPENPETTELFDANGKRITSLFAENRVEIPVVEMPKNLLNAIVAVEDERFYAHKGLDPIGTGRALVRNVMAGRVVQGGSTLTQQAAKNVYRLGTQRTLTRKLKEAVLAVKLENNYSKTEILGMYWNTIYLGRGAYGAEVASQAYFGKSVRDLTLSEAALMAALPQAPEYYPYHETDWQARQDVVLTKMAQQGYISVAEAEAARRAPVRVVAMAGAGGGGAPTAPFYMDLLMKELHDRYNIAAADLKAGGYRITTSLDVAMQQQAENAVRTELRADPDGHKPQVALVAIDPTTGYVKALVGGTGTEVDRNRAVEPQQPGSAFKPFVYAAALESRKHTALSTQMDAPAEFPGARAGETWRPQNANGKYSNAPATMREALRRSLNVVTAQWMNTLKPGPVIDLAKRMGVTSPIASNLTIGLGSSEVTPLELTAAYAPLANGGTAVKPLVVLRVEDQAGNVIADERPQRSSAIPPGMAFIVTDMLKGVLGPGGTASGVGGYLGGRPAAGKTGTTDEGRDAWFVGYTPDLVAGVWVGDDDNRPSRREGGSAAAPVWAKFMSGAMAGRAPRDWTPPTDVAQVDVCSLTALLPNPTCPLEREWFLTGTAPTTVDPTVHTPNLLTPAVPAPGGGAAPEAPFGTGAPPPGLGPITPVPPTPAPGPGTAPPTSWQELLPFHIPLPGWP